MKHLAILIITLPIAACAAPPVAYNHPSATLSQMHQDRAACASQTRGTAPIHQAGAGISAGAFQTCMAGKGYTPSRTGRLTVPDGLKIKTFD